MTTEEYDDSGIPTRLETAIEISEALRDGRHTEEFPNRYGQQVAVGTFDQADLAFWLEILERDNARLDRLTDFLDAVGQAVSFHGVSSPLDLPANKMAAIRARQAKLVEDVLTNGPLPGVRISAESELVIDVGDDGPLPYRLIDRRLRRIRESGE